MVLNAMTVPDPTQYSKSVKYMLQKTQIEIDLKRGTRVANYIALGIIPSGGEGTCRAALCQHQADLADQASKGAAAQQHRMYAPQRNLASIYSPHICTHRIYLAEIY